MWRQKNRKKQRNKKISGMKLIPLIFLLNLPYIGKDRFGEDVVKIY